MSTVRTVLGIALAGLLAPLAGCAPSFDELELTPRTTPPATSSPTRVTSSSIEIQAGLAIGVIARPLAGGQEMEEETVVELESDNPSVIGVDPALERGSFVIYGAGPGTASVDILINGAREGKLAATVTLQ